MTGPTNGEPVDRDMHAHTLCTADVTGGLMCETPPFYNHLLLLAMPIFFLYGSM